MLIAGDIGGTKTVVALYDVSDGDLRLIRDATFPSREFGSLEDILHKFLAGQRNLGLTAACFGVAGAVIGGKCKTTNLPWQLDEYDIADAVGARRGKLLNDLEAAAYGMLYLRPDELCPLNPKAHPRRAANVAVIAPGTGLGEAILYWDGQRHHPLASEGGHCSFAPQSDREIELLHYLRAKYNGHVSYERVLSGPGFTNVFHFLLEHGSHKPTTELRAILEKEEDPNAQIAQLGLDGKDPLCVEAVDMFCSIYGAEAGNLALKCVSVGGVFLGGGISPKILPALQKGPFLESFFAKGRFRSLLETMEVNVALNPRAPLIGAANYAALMK